ncbi:hypothetical protein OS493_039327 [Desmophyllum pertusum]|uniref:Uncharacterized protein n=1 Tax=Desmophyllum pertusum TaxID=174260 RepID=A0A9X0CDR7_9CNID|nr:hypothetical protein OS493_039327 [Desmophyllum pertusum]
MQFLSKQDAGGKYQDMSSDTSIGLQQLKQEILKHELERANWEKERSDLVRRQESIEEELDQVKQAKEEAEQQVMSLEREIRTKDEQ